MEEQFEITLKKLTDKLLGWLETLMLNTPNLIIALTVFFMFYWLSRSLGYALRTYLKKFVKQASIRELLANISSLLILSVGLLLALSILNLDEVLTSILAGAGVAGLAIGLALQGTLANTFSGVFLAINEIVNVGDWIETNGYKGRVVEINLRNLKLKESDNNIVIIPNKLVLENPFKNYGLTKRIKVNLNCGVAYDSNLKKVKQIAIDTVKVLFPPQHHEQIELQYLSFGDSSINFQLRFWLDATTTLTAQEAKSNVIIALKEAFELNSIIIPYPTHSIEYLK